VERRKRRNRCDPSVWIRVHPWRKQQPWSATIRGWTPGDLPGPHAKPEKDGPNWQL